MEQKKVQIIPYLAFCDNCEEAVNTYIHAFGGEILHLSRYSEETCGGVHGPYRKSHAHGIPPGRHPYVGRRQLRGRWGQHPHQADDSYGFQGGALHTISVLAEGGSILWPLQPHPKPDDGGCGSGTKDRFGYTWIITCPNPGKQ